MKNHFFSVLAISAALALSGFNNVSAQSGASLNFDGTNDAVNLGMDINTVLDPKNTVSVEAWVKPSTLSGLAVIVGNYNSDANNTQMQFLIRRDQDKYCFWVDDGTGFKSVYTGPGIAVLNTWQHVAGTWDGSEIKIYVNGVLAGTTTGVTGSSLASTSNSVKIGYNVLNENFTGNIDEVRIWSEARTQTNIQYSMNCTVDQESMGLVAYYSFNDGVNGGNNSSNTTLHDVTGNGHDGALVNFALTGTTSNFGADARSNYLSLHSSIGSVSNADRLNNGVGADFNGDGSNDLLVSDDFFNLRLYQNDGRGNFSAYTQITTGIGGKISVEDVDGDGDIDFSVPVNQTVRIYINNGSGTFTPITVNMNGTGSASISLLADLNNDNKMDLLIGNNSFGATDSNEVWLNTGSIGNAAFTFATGLSNTAGPRSSLSTGDVDGDGDVDILTGGYSFSAALFLNNNNNGTFSQGTIPGGYSSQVMLLDWDFDGDLDAMKYDNYNNVGLSISKNDGSGNFAAFTGPLLQSINSNTIYFKDLNADGMMDVVLSYWGGKGRIYLNTGCSLVFQTGCEYDLGFSDHGIALEDFNGDNSIDIFCLARNHRSTLYLNFLEPSNMPALPQITSSPAVSACDGSSAILSVTTAGPETVEWYSASTGGSALTTGLNYTVTQPAGSYTYYAEAVNSNGCRTAARTPVTLTVNSLPVISASSGSVAVCGDGTAMFGIVSAGTNSYQWYYGNTVAPNDSGVIVGGYGESGYTTDTMSIQNVFTNGYENYFVYAKVTSQYNCVSYSANDTIRTKPMPSVSTGLNSITISANENNAVYQWLDCNNANSLISGETNQSFTPTANGDYAVEVSLNGCVDTSACVNVTGVGLTTSGKDNRINLYPNPAKNILFVECEPGSLVFVVGAVGQNVIESMSVENLTRLDISSLSKGIYFVKVKSADLTKVEKLIIE